MAILTEDLIKQLEWEESASEAAADAAMRAIADSSGENQVAMSIGVDWLSENMDGLSGAISKKMKERMAFSGKRVKISDVLDGISPERCAVVLLSFAARACLAEKPVRFSSMSANAGVELCAMAAVEKAKKEHGDLVEKIGVKDGALDSVKWIQDRGIEISTSEREDAKALGIKMCEALVGTGVIELDKVNRSYMVAAGSIAGVMDDNIMRAVAMSHQARPTLIKPVPWSLKNGVMEGGFHGALRNGRPHVVRTTAGVQRLINKTWSSMGSVVNAVNTLQEVEWSIDDRVMQVMQALDWTLSDNEKLMVDAAAEMARHEKHYHVWTADYRYRLYSEAGLINPQGGDVQKSLLRAHKGKVIGTESEVVRFFKMGVAGKYGVDNVSIPDRLRWVDEHHDQIVGAGNEPLGEHIDFWMGAEKPWQFLQVCFEYAGWVADPEGFVATVVATPLDGKCSGIQHFSAMGRDEVGAAATCLARNKPGAEPNDIYNDVRAVVERKVFHFSSSRFSSPERKMAKKWIAVGIDRGDVKRSVMTMPYSATERACLDQVLSSMRSKGKMRECQFDGARFLQPILWESIPEVVGYARKAMDWIQKSAGSIIEARKNTPTPWIEFKNPNGAVIYQTCWKNKTKRFCSGDLRIQLARPDWGNVDARKHRLGISPNFIHSCDAAHMHNVIARMKGHFLHMIHDSFGTLPSDTPKLYRVIREEMVAMYKHFGLHMLREQYPFLDKPPRRGSFDIDEILDAEFAFM